MTGNEARQLRKERKLTQQELAEKLGFKSRKSVMKWEDTENVPKVIELALLALIKLDLDKNDYKTAGSKIADVDLYKPLQNDLKQYRQ